MISIVYVSSAVTPFTQSELTALLETSRRNNAAGDVTGMLLYKEGNFMQALEGPETAVRRVHSRIESDSRHKGLLTLVDKPITERQFPGWSMGFRDLATQSLRAVDGYNEFLNTPFTGREFSSNPSLAQKLLLTFKQNM